MNTFRQIHGDELADYDEGLKKVLDDYEREHLDFFKERKGKWDSDQHDFLHHHYAARCENGRYWFTIVPDSDLPESMKGEIKEVVSKFTNEFQQKKSDV